MTSRERYLLVMVANGLSSKQIAMETNMTIDTATTTIARIVKKYGVKNRAQLVALGFRMKELI